VVESGGLLIEADVVEELGADAYVYGRTRFGDSEQQIIARGHVHLFRVSDGARLAS
jgi:multiple sugar transport system ATP-binding protein